MSDQTIEREVGLLPVFTLVLWLGCLFVGAAGFLLQAPHRMPPASQPTTLQTEVLNVEISNDVPPDEQAAASELPAVAAFSPAIAFALPIEGPVRLIEMSQAVPAQPRRLTFGQGEGRQPAPEYPREAVLARQQGTVIIVFTVAEDGRVTTASATSPSPWPILNQAALRKIRDSWRFPAGRVRSYQVAIEFQLKQ